MNKAQIKAELRRSACEDKRPFYGCEMNAFSEACRWKEDHMESMDHNWWRTFFLLVAEAL